MSASTAGIKPTHSVLRHAPAARERGTRSPNNAWAHVGKVGIIATTRGRFVPVGRIKTIQPFETSVVKAIRVIEGQHVSAGDVLLELDPTENEAERDKAAQQLAQARLDSARLQALIAGAPDFVPPAEADAARVATARRQMRAQQGEQFAKLTDLDHQIGAKVAELRQDQAEIARIDATLPTLEGHVGIRAEGIRTGAGNKLDLLDSQRQLTEQQHQRLVDEQKLSQTAQEMVALQQQRVQAEQQYRKELLADLAKAEEEAADHAQEQIKAAQRTALETLHVPVADTVQQIAAHTVGGVVTPAQPLMV